jgi:cell shape-determining protein MreC
MGPEWIVGLVAVVGIFIVLPKTFFRFIGDHNKHKRETDLEKLKYQKEILELELEKQRNEIKLLEEENRKYDNIIKGSGD